MLFIFENKSKLVFASAEITSGVLASSIRILSTSSTIAKAFFLKHKISKSFFKLSLK